MKSVYLERQKEVLPRTALPTEGGSSFSNRPPELPDVTASPASVSPALHYPVGCLVFVKNLNPNTNKTVLRSLLASPFSTEPSSCIDYVEYNKGLDSVGQGRVHFECLAHPESYQCHVRLSSPIYAKLLVDYFTTNRVVQADGQDAKGQEGDAQGCIAVQVVTGRLEELYWDKVPERIRLDALRRIHRQDVSASEQAMHGASDGKRKKRKKLP